MCLSSSVEVIDLGIHHSPITADPFTKTLILMHACVMKINIFLSKRGPCRPVHRPEVFRPLVLRGCVGVLMQWVWYLLLSHTAELWQRVMSDWTLQWLMQRPCRHQWRQKNRNKTKLFQSCFSCWAAVATTSVCNFIYNSTDVNSASTNYSFNIRPV